MTAMRKEQIEVKIKLVPGGKLPEKKTKGAAAWDCYARINDWGNDTLVIKNGQRGVKVPLGFCLALPEGYHAEIVPRSSLGTKTGLRMSNSFGVIDSDYRGEVCALFDRKDKALENKDYDVIQDGERLVQLLIVKDPAVTMVQVDELEDTERGAGGFGSTGSK